MKNDRQHELDKTTEILDVITGLDYRLAMASLLSAYTTIMIKIVKYDYRPPFAGRLNEIRGKRGRKPIVELP